ncbi:MAG: M23 family metallopeptidase [Treponema sp.]|nr:M23 family metallopeptidase [Treponema sp.]
MFFPLPCQDLPYTGEEKNGRITSIERLSLPRITSPKFVSTWKLKSQEEKEQIQSQNEIWQQYQKDMERYRKIKNLPKNYPSEKIRENPRSLFYIYKVLPDKDKYLDTFNGLYARFQTGQGTLATINHISSPDSVKAGMEIILPIPQGLFIPKKADSALEILLQKEFSSQIDSFTQIYEIDGEEFYFLPDQFFSSTLMAFFRDSGMQLPLSKKIVTSEFGYRTSPISGQWKFHAGIDLAAPIGTEVFACKNGSVATTGYSDIYGYYIDIKHSGNIVSRYAHLSKILVKKGDLVSTGKTIGLTGISGASTGPHLHFEIRENGKAKDPAKQIRNF